MQGKFVKKEINPELDYDFSFELPDCEVQVLEDVDIKPGQHENLQIKLKRIPNP